MAIDTCVQQDPAGGPRPRQRHGLAHVPVRQNLGSALSLSSRQKSPEVTRIPHRFWKWQRFKGPALPWNTYLCVL